MKASGKKIVMDPKAALSRGTNAIKDYRLVTTLYCVCVCVCVCVFVCVRVCVYVGIR